MNSGGSKMTSKINKINLLMGIGSIIVFISSLCIAEEYGSRTVLQGSWGRPEPTVREKALGAPPLTKTEEVILGYIPEEKEVGPDDFQIPASGPKDFGVDRAGNIYIVDTLKQRIVKFDKKGKYILDFGKRLDFGTYFDQPINIALDGQGNIYVKALDRDMSIFKFNSSGNFLEEITSIGSYNADQIKWISYLYPDNRGHIFIRAEVEEGKYVNFEFDEKGKIIREFQGAIWKCDSEGKLYKDSRETNDISFPEIKGSKRPVQILSSDKKIEKEIILDFGTESAVYFGLLGVDDDGNMYYSNWNRDTDEILKFNNDGELVKRIKIKSGNTFGMENNGFKILPDGTIYQMHATDEGLSIIKYESKEQRTKSSSEDKIKEGR